MVNGECIADFCADPDQCTEPAGCCASNDDCNYLDEPPDDVMPCGIKGYCENGSCTSRANCDVSFDGNCCAELGLPELFHDALAGSASGERHGGTFTPTGFRPMDDGYIRYDTAGKIDPEFGAACITVKPVNTTIVLTGSLLTTDDAFVDGFSLRASHLSSAPVQNSRITFMKWEDGASTTIDADKNFRLSDEHTLTAHWGPAGKEILFGADVVAQDFSPAGGSIGTSIYLGDAYGTSDGAQNAQIRDFYICGTLSSSSSSSFSITPICGDGILDTGEQCETTVACPSGYSCSNCQCFYQPFSSPIRYCGNGILESGETCDDGNQQNGDGCSSLCRWEQTLVARCGDGFLDADEECDDGNQQNGDDCSQDCQREHLDNCGNGIVESQEECDDGNRSDNDGCSVRCQWEGPIVAGGEVCGNGIVESLEECDDGLFNGVAGNPCGVNCTFGMVGCTENNQCLAGYVCVDDQCVPCALDDQCPTNLCLDGVCSACTSGEQCSTHLCLNGICLPCASDTDCEDGQVCRNGSCLPCTANNQCKTGLCQNGACIPCTQNDQCPTNLCLDGVCSVCSSNLQCALGQICRGGWCVDTPTQIAQNLSHSSLPMTSTSSHGTTISNATVIPFPVSSSSSSVTFFTPLAASISIFHPVTAIPVSPQGPSGETGPASAAVMAAGAAAGFAWARRKKRKKGDLP